MSNNGPFGIDPDDFDRAVREAAENLWGSIGSVGKFLESGDRAVWSSVLGSVLGGRKPAPHRPEADAAGVWVVYTLADDGSAHIEQVFPAEIDALRAHRDNTDANRKVRFLPFGVAVSVLDREAD